ncbi:MAG TPA: hypothetical protein VNJ29_03875, partial [Candidatus Nitrosotenuis sp.]|nr:hypothetical protein [Candidatus Nitrosotenuis sp.]
KLVIIGDKGMAIFDDTQDWGHKVQFFDHITNDSSTHAELIPGKAQSIIVQVQEPLRQECQHFLDCIQQQMMPITHATDASQVVAIIEACHESIEENCSLVYGTSSQDSLLTDHQGRQESKDEPTYGVVLH